MKASLNGSRSIKARTVVLALESNRRIVFILRSWYQSYLHFVFSIYANQDANTFLVGCQNTIFGRVRLGTGDGILIIFHVEVFLGTFATKKSRRTFCLSLTLILNESNINTLHTPRTTRSYRTFICGDKSSAC